ncbi:MAG: hypothetical protein NT000_04165 [Proteobacteria bacterium]|nr:hypothetical protein [Pseudomonadota bacterium]
MKGKLINMMRRWWLMALVSTLALSLTSCAKRRNYNLSGDYGYVQCDGTNWSFDVYTFRSQSQNGGYDLVIMPVSIDTPGDIASVTIANSNQAYKQLVSQIVLNPEQEISAGTLSAADFNNYPILAITPFDPSSNFVSQNSTKSTFCNIPVPGQGF